MLTPDAGPPPVASLDWFDRPTATSPGTFNLCYNSLDRHVVRGLAEEQALLHPFAPAGVRTTYTYAELLERVAQLAGGFRELGVRAGATIVLALPVTPELVIGLLACARVGAVAVPRFEDAVAAERPAVAVVDAARKAEVDLALARSGRTPAYQVVVRPDPGSLDPAVGDIDLAVVMKPGAFEPAVCAELPPASPFLTIGPVVHGHDWAFDLLSSAAFAGWEPGVYVTPADDPTSLAPYAALIGPLLVGATIELR